ncbi:hypothetical protein IHQ71_18705 [Rhizobium sp. TH2]|uniref:hypothetical protein n=1 Tax=Rhizobium sp. TH2 TaxID=2775403 RepID=UPI0021576978|nr:hypothetical protein [Rhizobium sp. TH2]UVC07237.1 hypothetical protein IHQ71_18705 [Rhizobium sp. TH2]
MASRIKSLVGAETIRDGGSLAASFLDEHDGRWILFLKLRCKFGNGQIEKFGFDEPVLIDARAESRPPNTPSIIHSSLAGPYSSLSWREARELTSRFSEQASNLDEWASKAFTEICMVIASEGKLPSNL